MIISFIYNAISSYGLGYIYLIRKKKKANDFLEKINLWIATNSTGEVSKV